METGTRTREVIKVLPAGTISGTKVIEGIKYRVRKHAGGSTKGRKKTSDYLEFKKALLKGQELLWSEHQMIIGFYIIFSINTGLRVSEVLNIKHCDLVNLKTGDQLTVQEHKTKKSRTIQINQVILKSYQSLSGRLQDRSSYQVNDYIFKSQKNSLFTTGSLNRILKEVFAGDAQNISTHSLRKTFGREVYDSHLQSEYSIMALSDIFNHSCMSITRRYLGIRQQELNTIYKNLGKRSPGTASGTGPGVR